MPLYMLLVHRSKMRHAADTAGLAHGSPPWNRHNEMEINNDSQGQSG
jgi:hypothetical protein